MVITLEHACHARGYTGWDHLLDDTPLSDLIGRRYRSVGEARRAAERVSMRSQDRRCRNAPVRLTVRLASGEIVEVR